MAHRQGRQYPAGEQSDTRELLLALSWTGGAQNVNLQVLNFHAWTFYFGISCLLGLYSLHRLSFVQEPAGTSDRLLLRHLFLEARRSVNSLSSAAGLVRNLRLPPWPLRLSPARAD